MKFSRAKRAIVRWITKCLQQRYFARLRPEELDFVQTHRSFVACEHIADILRVQNCHVKGHLILIDAESEIEKYRSRSYAGKEPETLEWIERYFRPGDVMYDIGANIGLCALFAAKHLGGACQVFAFEPEALNYGKLSKNIYQNGLSGVVIPCCLAITDRVGFDTFFLNPDNFENMVNGQKLVAGSSMHSFGAAQDYCGTTFQPVHMQGAVGVPLDYLWQVWGLDFPNHVKIDVDGREEQVIAGASKTLADRRLQSVLVEVSGKESDADLILQKLAEVGFTRVTDFAAHSTELLKGTPYEDCVNSVFVRGL